MELTLKLLTGRNAGKEIKVSASKFLIGRADDCHLRPHSEMVSRHHCVLLIEEGFCAVRDFGSRNGTYVNGEQVVGQRELHNGDRLKVAHLEFDVQLTSRVGGKSRSKVKSVKEAAKRTAAASGHDDLELDDEISDWLSDGEEKHSDTRELDFADTKMPPHETPAPQPAARETTFIKSKTEETISADLVDDEAEEHAKDTDKAVQTNTETAKRIFGGKPAGVAKGGAKDSREAAADALRKFFTNRKQ